MIADAAWFLRRELDRSAVNDTVLRALIVAQKYGSLRPHEIEALKASKKIVMEEHGCKAIAAAGHMLALEQCPEFLRKASAYFTSKKRDVRSGERRDVV